MILGIWGSPIQQASIYPPVQNMLLAARALYGRWRHPVTNSDVLRIEGHGVKAPIAQRRRHLIDALIGRNMRTKIWVGRGHRSQLRQIIPVISVQRRGGMLQQLLCARHDGRISFQSEVHVSHSDRRRNYPFEVHLINVIAE